MSINLETNNSRSVFGKITVSHRNSGERNWSITTPKWEKRKLQRIRCSNFRILELMLIHTVFKNPE